MTRDLRGRRVAARSLTMAVGAAAVLAVQAPTALAVPTTVAAGGLEAPSGAIVDPAGHLWVSDHGAGFCRVTANGLDAGTCLGGALAIVPGPAAPGQPAFQDPTPGAPNSGDEVAYVPDGAAQSSEVDVLAWEPASGRFRLARTLTMAGALTRPNAVSVGPDGNLYVAFLRAPAGDIQRVVNPLSTSASAEVVGHSDGAATLAAGYDAAGALTVYVAEAGGIMQLHPDAAAQPSTQPSPFDVGVIGNPAAPRELGALAYDRDDHVLWAGTADAAHVGTGVDEVDRFSTDSGARTLGYATGLTTVGGFGLDGAGNVFVADAPSPNPGGGRLLLAADVDAPATPVINGPADRATVDGSAPLRVSSPSDAALRWECSLDGGAFLACAPGEPLAFAGAGSHTLRVRATDRAGNVSPVSAPAAFTVRPAPAPVASQGAARPETRPARTQAPKPTPVGPAGALTYRVASRTSLRVAVSLPSGTRAVRLRLSRLSGGRARLVTSVIRGVEHGGRYRTSLRVKPALRPGRYRLEVAGGATVTTLSKPTIADVAIR